MSDAPIRVTVWNEFQHEKKEGVVKKLYPKGMHDAIASYLKTQPGMEVRTATLEEPEHGLTEEVLNNTDVLTWWGHVAHGEVSDEIVDRVHRRVLDGMGIIIMHSGHFSKIFVRLMGTSCGLSWREAAEKERLWVVDPSHPIAQGVGKFIQLENTEMYGEHFDVPKPDQLVFVSWSEGGEVFRSGMTYRRGRGKVFYFRPGHEAYPIYYNKEILRVIANGIRWAKFNGNTETSGVNNCPCITEPLEEIPDKHYDHSGIEHPTQAK